MDFRPMLGLYGEGLITPDARTSYYIRGSLSGIPLIGGFFDSYYRTIDNMAYMDDYMKNTGLGYEDILYPSRTTGYGSASGMLNFVSDNISRLYR